MARRLTLRHGGRTFLDRWGVECRWFGVFLHHIAGPDPGIDIHDHPWPFVTLILRGGYSERAADIREPWMTTFRRWPRWSIHRMPLTIAHRILRADPGTWTLVIRGRKSRDWGFYLWEDNRWVPWRDYDFVSRRANAVESNRREERMGVPLHDRITLDEMGVGRDA